MIYQNKILKDMKNKNNKIISSKRKDFENLSAQMRLKVLTGQFKTVNEALRAHYASLGHTELHSFLDWLLLGYQVKKGEKALLLWSKPMQKKAKTENPNTGDQEELETDKQFHGIKHVFSNLQVEERKPKNNNPQ